MRGAVDYIENFIRSLELTSQSELLARMLFKSKEDCKEFYINFLGRSNSTAYDLIDYRVKKIELSTLSLADFIESCTQLGIKDTFENHFYYYLGNSEVELINNLIVEKKTLLVEIFNSFKENPQVNIFKAIL